MVEAGNGNPQDTPEITTPLSTMDLRNSKYDWAYKTTIVKRDDYERVEKPNTRGKTLGGSSSLNYFTRVPGCKPTFTMWNEYGGQEWTWDPLLLYLRKTVTYPDDPGLYPSDLAKIGSGGPIHIPHAELLDEMAPFREAVTQAWLSHSRGLTQNIGRHHDWPHPLRRYHLQGHAVGEFSLRPEQAQHHYPTPGALQTS
ncbi:GMC oxidoreductase [Aspergillus carbonarius ITEM 5010]|uniref:GMC oxidoreductase n=1 Tax=Aspergillus carbonarius (strain ITEM 5010) TaxID=602072 RepID=A0A1R3RAK2_ASPC5|nr:GMC oxidoreductase [Aspergillus carbonarius ITEM 5010]